VQFVKYMLRLLNDTGRPTRGSRRTGHFMADAALRAGGPSAPRPAFTGRYGYRRGLGAGR